MLVYFGFQVFFTCLPLKNGIFYVALQELIQKLSLQVPLLFPLLELPIQIFALLQRWKCNIKFLILKELQIFIYSSKGYYRQDHANTRAVRINYFFSALTSTIIP